MKPKTWAEHKAETNKRDTHVNRRIKGEKVSLSRRLRKVGSLNKE